MSTDAVRAGGKGGNPARTPRTVGIVGLFLGGFAFWLALPPIAARAIVCRSSSACLR